MLFRTTLKHSFQSVATHFKISCHYSESDLRKSPLSRRIRIALLVWLLLKNVFRDNKSHAKKQSLILRSLQWRHNDHDGVKNHHPHGCLFSRLFRHRSKKTSKLCVTGLCAGNSPGPVNSPHKGPVTRKMFPFDDVIMNGTRASPELCIKFISRDSSHVLVCMTFSEQSYSTPCAHCTFACCACLVCMMCLKRI